MHHNAYDMHDTMTQLPDGRWVPARGEPQPWRMRLWNAWEVLQGRADSVVFPGQGHPKVVPPVMGKVRGR